MLHRLWEFLQRGELKASSSTAQKFLTLPNSGGCMEAYGTTVPTDATAGYATGCRFIHTDGTRGTALYINEGSATSCDFNPVLWNPYGTASGRGPSPLIWNTCPVLQYTLDPTVGMHYFNDFQGNYALAANQTATLLDGGVMGFTGATAGSTISMDTDAPNGTVALNCTTDNESVGISVLGGKNAAAQFVFTAGKKSWFEARIKTVNITDAKYGLFLGFAEEALLAEDGVLGDSDAMADKDYFGFLRVAADGDKLDIVHNTASGGGMTTDLADAITVVADTYIKVGFYCDGTTITCYADGAAVTSGTATLAGTNFPDGEEMGIYYVLNAAHGDDCSARIDWVRVAREF